MKRLSVLSLLFIVTLLLFLFLPTINYQPITILAQSPEELTRKLREKQEEITKLETKLIETRKQTKTLKSQLEIIDGQTKITELKIEETNLKIERLKREIADLSVRINRASATIDTISNHLLDRIIQTYKYSSISTIDLLFSSRGFANLIERLKYTQVAQASYKKKLYELQATKAFYNDQKQDRQQRQQEAEKLGNELEAYKAQLAQQKADKEELLKLTKNDETRFQGLIAQLKADAESIARAISNVGVVIGPIKKGQQIGAEGLSGCTSGPHLHFEVFENAKIEGSRVVGDRVNPHKYLDSSTLGPPMPGYPSSTRISTEYGEVYVLGTHTGLDIYDDKYVGTPILAVADGTAYAISDRGCPGLAGFDHGPAKGVVIDHHNGLVTLYWHLL